MEASSVQRHRVKGAILSTACIALILSISDNARGKPQEPLPSSAPAPAVSLSPTSLFFGRQPLGTTSSPPQTVKLSNTGNATLSIYSIAITGANANDFAEQASTCGSSLPAGHNCTISMTFKPLAMGLCKASLSIKDNASGSPQTVSLSGVGTTFALTTASVAPTSLAFGDEPGGTASSTQTVTLSNTGEAPLSIASLAATGTNADDYAPVGDTCGTSLAPSANCMIAVTFMPCVIGTETALLRISDNAIDSPQTVSLSGTTEEWVLSWTPSKTPGVIGYNVYRGTAAGGPYPDLLNSKPVKGTTYTDRTVQATQRYYYVVTAVASDGVTQSAPSDQAPVGCPR
jgi:hypothetical protein